MESVGDSEVVIETTAREVVPVQREVEQRFREAEAEINEWLDEAVEEGAAIVERARAEAERLRTLAHDQAERLRLAAERAAAEAARAREQVLREAEAEAAGHRSETSSRMAQALREAESAAAARRRAAAEEAADLLAESRAAAERAKAEAEREAAWRLRQAEADASALEHRAASTVASLQADVGLLQQQLTELVEHAMTLLPALDSAAKNLASGAAGLGTGRRSLAEAEPMALPEAEVEALPAAELDGAEPMKAPAEPVIPAVDGAAEAWPAQTWSAHAAQVADVVAAEACEAPDEAEAHTRGLGQLTPHEDELVAVADGAGELPAGVRRRRPLGRLLGRR
jgi:hypothetical protein